MDISKRIVNHIVFVIDDSGSMSTHRTSVPKVFDNLLSKLKDQSIKLNQETRVSIYYFNGTVRCSIFDTDVMRVQSIAGTYSPTGNTALCDAVTKAISDHQTLPQIYSDHGFLVYIITDGEENASTSNGLTNFRKTLAIQDVTNNWTIGVMVPNSSGTFAAKSLGFQSGNISVWDVNGSNAIEKVGTTTFNVLTQYMNMRTTGVRKTSNLFEINTNDLTKKEAKAKLTKVPLSTLTTLRVNSVDSIQPFVTRHLGSYKIGSAYYQLTKPEKVQASKDILIRRRATGEIFANARELLGLPNTDTKVAPGNFGEWDIFVKSTSYNRKLTPATDLIVRTT